MSVAKRWQEPLCPCCCGALVGQKHEPISLEKDYYLDLCDECADYAENGGHAAYREVINMCMTGGR